MLIKAGSNVCGQDENVCGQDENVCGQLNSGSNMPEGNINFRNSYIPDIYIYHSYFKVLDNTIVN